MTPELFVTVSFTDGHKEQWPLPVNQTPDEVFEELRRVIVTGQWFRPAESTKAYSPYAIVAVEVAAARDSEAPSVAQRFGEAVGDAFSPTGGEE